MCLNHSKAAGVKISIHDIDLAHRIPARNATSGPQPAHQRISDEQTQRCLQDLTYLYWIGSRLLFGRSETIWSPHPQILTDDKPKNLTQFQSSLKVTKRPLPSERVFL
ncbi:hypothetical protein P5673_018716 [Acropora cervicornis]|uniref:Uncharacterized protein n=1 Tax=Acropora cervicornis TaxID=6130 RepID=A0AAD9QDT3_ACRCE|nr:hypothetical protein P5673_018716 [Acropora cervicornis]